MLYQYGQQKHLLSELVVEFIERLYRIEPIFTLSHNEIIGYDLMEVLSGVRKQTPKTIPTQPKPAWIRLLSQIPCLIASDVGKLIVAERSSIPDSQCNTVVSGRNYLAVTMDMLTLISKWAGQRDPTANSWKMPDGYWTAASSHDFNPCGHTDDSGTCWDKPDFLQSVTKKPRDCKQGVVRLPEAGVVVFGGKDRGSVESLLSQFSRTEI